MSQAAEVACSEMRTTGLPGRDSLDFGTVRPQVEIPPFADKRLEILGSALAAWPACKGSLCYSWTPLWK